MGAVPDVAIDVQKPSLTWRQGVLIFWPAAVLDSFVAFVITNFIVAFGLSLLLIVDLVFLGKNLDIKSIDAWIMRTMD